jgi:hypothetical protein
MVERGTDRVLVVDGERELGVFRLADATELL